MSTTVVNSSSALGIPSMALAAYRNAIDARRVARNAIEVAVREARSVNWSWDQISAALGGEPNGEVLRRKFGSGG